MARSFNGTSEQIITGTSGPTGTTFSISALVNPTGAAGSYKILYGYGSIGLFIRNMLVEYYDGGDRAVGGTTIATGEWSQIGVGSGGGSTQTFYRGAQDGTYASDVNLPNNSATGIAGHTGEYFDGAMAEFAIWTEKLDAAEWAALGKGVSPKLIRPHARVAHLDLVRNIQDVDGLLSLAVTGTSVVSHPRVIYPRRRQAYNVAAAAGGSVFTPYYYREHIARAG